MRISHFFMGLLAMATQGIFAQPIPPNDTCSKATALVIQVGNCSSSLLGTTLGAKPGGPTALIPSGADDDVWYKFTTPSDPDPGKRFSVNLSLTEVSYTGTLPGTVVIERREGTAELCGGFIENNNFLYFNAPGNLSWFMNGLKPSTEYSLRIYTMDEGAGVALGYRICLNMPATPANDNCENAVVLTPTLETCTGEGPFNTLGATQSPQISGDGAGRDDDVWFSFTTSSVTRRYFAKLSDYSFTGGFGNPVIELWDSCAAESNKQFFPFSTYADLGVLPPNTNYKLRVYTYSTSSRFQSFKLCVSMANVPLNDDCANASPVPVGTGGSWGTPVVATTLYAGSGPPAPAICYASEDDDIWFSFTAPASGLVGLEINGVTNVMHPGNPAPALSTFLYSGACNSLTQIRCFGVNTGLLSGLTPGTVYRLRVMTTDNMQGASFQIRLKEELPPSNDNCNIPVLIPINTDGTFTNFVTGSTLGAGPSGVSVSPCTPIGLNDVWFNFRAPATGTAQFKLFNITNPAGGSIAMYAILYSGSCEVPVQVKCISTTNDIFTGLTPLAPYLVRIMSNTADQVVNFSVAMRELPATMANTNCENVRTITVEPQAGTTLGLPGSSEIVACYGGKAPNKVAYYRFVATATWNYLEFSNLLALSENQAALGYRVYSGECDGNLVGNTIYCNGGVKFSNAPITGLTIGNTYYVQLMENTYNGGPVAFKVRLAPPNAFVWTGGTSTAWEDYQNWANKAVPNAGSEIILPPGMPRYPLITVSTTVLKLTASPGTSVQVAPGVHLVVLE